MLVRRNGGAQSSVPIVRCTLPVVPQVVALRSGRRILDVSAGDVCGVGPKLSRFSWERDVFFVQA